MKKLCRATFLIILILILSMLIFVACDEKATSTNVPSDDKSQSQQGGGDNQNTYTEGLVFKANPELDGTVAVVGYNGFDNEVVIPSEYNGHTVMRIGERAFEGIWGLTSVTIPDSMTSIGSNAFLYCYKLIEVYNKSSLTLTAGSSGNGYVAYYAENVYTTEGGSKLSTDENGYVVYVDGDVKILVAYTGTETELTLPSGITQINDYAFYYRKGLTSITIPDSVTSIGDYAFRGCSGLTSVTIGNSVTRIGKSAFYECTGLTSIYYNGDVAGWCGISGLGDLMCYGSSYYGLSLKTLYIDGKKVGGELIIPNGVTSIGSSAFYDCSGLTSVVIPDSVTSIGSSAFSGCTGLTSITIPDSVTSIGDYAFRDCTGLTTINWNATACTSAGSSSYPIFYGCINLTTVNIGDNVTTIPSYAFYERYGLTDINYKGTKAQWNAIGKGYHWNYNVNSCKIVCADGTIEI